MKVEGVTCPGCGRNTVEYNGNYYCKEALERTGVCNWIMDPDLPTKRRPTADLVISLTHLLANSDRHDYIEEYTAELKRRKKAEQRTK